MLSLWFRLVDHIRKDRHFPLKIMAAHSPNREADIKWMNLGSV